MAFIEVLFCGADSFETALLEIAAEWGTELHHIQFLTRSPVVVVTVDEVEFVSELATPKTTITREAIRNTRCLAYGAPSTFGRFCGQTVIYMLMLNC